MSTRVKRIEIEHREIITAPVSEVFPLACPVEEKKWISGWDYDLVYSESGKNENNCIFSESMTVRHFMGPGSNSKSYWITTKYDIDSHIVHFVIDMSDIVFKLEIEMQEKNSQAEVKWSMVMTPLTEKGQNMVKSDMEEKMRLMLAFLGSSLKHYCETGQILGG